MKKRKIYTPEAFAKKYPPGSATPHGKEGIPIILPLPRVNAWGAPLYDIVSRSCTFQGVEV